MRATAYDATTAYSTCDRVRCSSPPTRRRTTFFTAFIAVVVARAPLWSALNSLWVSAAGTALSIQHIPGRARTLNFGLHLIGDSSELDAHCSKPIHRLGEDGGLLELQVTYLAEEFDLGLIV